MLKNFISDIKTKLSIDGGEFVNSEIEHYVSKIPPAQYQEFFNALSGDEFRFHKGIDRVAIVAKKFFGEQKTDYEYEAECIASLMHSINKTVINESISKGEDYMFLMRSINIRATFDVSDKQAYVLNEIGGREAIICVNTTEPNALLGNIIKSLEKYDRENGSNTLKIAGNIKCAIALPDKGMR